MPLSVKKVINNLGHEAFSLKDEKKLRIKNGEVAELSLKKNAIVITLDSDFLSIKKEIQKKSKIIYIKLHPRDPKIIGKIIQKHLNNAIAKLSIPGKVTLTETEIKFDTP